MPNEQSNKIDFGRPSGINPAWVHYNKTDSKCSPMQRSFDFNAASPGDGSDPSGIHLHEIINMQNSPQTIENINYILIERLDRNVTLQTEISSKLEKMLAVQEEKIDQQEKLGANLVKMMEERRVESDHKFDEHNKKIAEVEKSIGNTLVTHLEALRRDQSERHKEFAIQQKEQLQTFVESVKTSSQTIEKKVSENTSRISKIERLMYIIIGVSGLATFVVEYIVPVLIHAK